MKSSLLNVKFLVVLTIILTFALANSAVADADLWLRLVRINNYRNPYYPGDSLRISSYILNIGDSASDSYTIDIYAGGHIIGSTSRDSVEPGGYETEDAFSLSCSLPYDISEGWHGIWAELSCSNDSNPDNNSESDGSIRIAIKEPTSVEIRSVDAYGEFYLPGESIAVSIEVKGVGGQLENTFDIDVYASEDMMITTSDYEIYSYEDETIDPGESRLLSEECQLPSDIPAGDYYIGIIITYSVEGGTDSTTYNDHNTVYIGGYSDLAVQSVGITPGAYLPGEEFVVYSLIKNVGGGSAESYTVDYYVSTDAVITADDHHIGYVERDSLPPGQQHSYETTNRFPFNIPSGNYYIGAIATCPTESDLSNNTSCSEATNELVHPADFVCGQMLYQDRDRSPEHPIRYALVEVYDADDNENALDDRVIGKTHTDHDGNYGVAVLNDETSSKNIYVKVFTESPIGAYPDTTNKAGIVRDNVFNEVYYLKSDLYPHPRDLSVVVNMTALKYGGEFMVYDSMIEGYNTPQKLGA